MFLNNLLSSIYCFFLSLSLCHAAFEDPHVDERIDLPKEVVQDKSQQMIGVAVIEGGFDTHHKKIAPRLLTGFNAANFSEDVAISHLRKKPDIKKAGELIHYAHGTLIAGCVLQAAHPSAMIFPVALAERVQEGGYQKDGIEVLINALNYISLIEDVKVVNISARIPLDYCEGKEYDDLYAALINVMASGKIIVNAAGNSGKAFGYEGKKELLKLAQDPRAKNRLIFVGGTAEGQDESAEVMFKSEGSTSSVAGDRGGAAHFISAPGAAVPSYLPREMACFGQFMGHPNLADMMRPELREERYEDLVFWGIGTSGAAAIVSGALTHLLVIHDDVDLAVESLFRGAKTGPDYPQEVFGHGLLNVNKSLEVLKETFEAALN